MRTVHPVTVMLDETRPLNDVISDLTRHGFQLERSWVLLGAVSGTVESSRGADLEAVNGVSMVKVYR